MDLCVVNIIEMKSKYCGLKIDSCVVYMNDVIDIKFYIIISERNFMND